MMYGTHVSFDYGLAHKLSEISIKIQIHVQLLKNAFGYVVC